MHLNYNFTQCIFLCYQAHKPYSRWPPWANVWYKYSCEDVGGLKELSNKTPWLSFKPNFYILKPLGWRPQCVFSQQNWQSWVAFSLCSQIKWSRSWQPVKKQSVNVLVDMLGKKTHFNTSIISVWLLHYLSSTSFFYLFENKNHKITCIKFQTFVDFCHHKRCHLSTIHETWNKYVWNVQTCGGISFFFLRAWCSWGRPRV